MTNVVPFTGWLPRSLLILTGGLLLVLCAGFIGQWSWATRLWPWPDSPLSYRFVASILAAIALPILWIASTREVAALRAGSLDFALNYAVLGGVVWWLRDPASTWVSVPLVLSICVVSVLFNLWLYLRVRQVPFQDTQPVPTLVDWSFLLFALVLILVGIALVMRYQTVFPWSLQPQTSVVFGCVFLGASMYFIHGFVFTVWGNVRGQLLGFLAYDAILIGPFLSHLGRVTPDHQLSLWVYLGVLFYSAGLAVYYLFINSQTRFRFGST